MLVISSVLLLLLLAAVLFLCIRSAKWGEAQKILSGMKDSEGKQEELARQLIEKHHEQRSSFDQHALQTSQHLRSGLTEQMHDLRAQIQTALKQQQISMGAQFEQLTQVTSGKLKDISQQVDESLTRGFEKTNATFNDVIKRLTIIDEAQKKIGELSSHLVSLQEILIDNRSRGAFGETQLSALIHNMLPENSFSMQHTLSNGKRVDCLLYLPQPTGNIAIDAKFPLAAYRALSSQTLTDIEKKQYQTQFKRDIKIHIQAIADKYLVPGETADGAIMFIPAEAVFSEIHAQHPDIVEYSHQRRVWLTSPTTMMAILTTARAVMKDEATKEQVHLIQRHLNLLGVDFERFQKRMDQLAKHINQAQQDVSQVHISSQKITQRFNQIEAAEISLAKAEPEQPALNVEEP